MAWNRADGWVLQLGKICSMKEYVSKRKGCLWMKLVSAQGRVAPPLASLEERVLLFKVFQGLSAALGVPIPGLSWALVWERSTHGLCLSAA